MKNVKLLRFWHNSTVTEVTVGHDVCLQSFIDNPPEGDNRRYIIDKIDGDRLEVTLRLNLLGTHELFVVGRNDLTDEYAFFGQI